MCPIERERDPPGCRASGLTHELPVHVVLVSSVAGSVVVGSAAASFSGAGTDGATSIAPRLLFSGLPSEVSSSSAVVVTKKLRLLLVPATALSHRLFFAHFLAAPEAYKRGRISDVYITLKLNNMHFNCNRHN